MYESRNLKVLKITHLIPLNKLTSTLPRFGFGEFAISCPYPKEELSQMNSWKKNAYIYI